MNPPFESAIDRPAFVHGGEAAPSPWVQRWSHLVAQAGSVLDVACGTGRHVRWFEQRGCRVTGVDRDAAAVEPLRSLAGTEIVVADIEAGPWPFVGRRFDAVVVTRYLWRERLADIVDAVGPGGVLIYETFAAGNETVGKPSNPKFLLAPGELLRIASALRVVAYEDGFESAPERFVQRIVAARTEPVASGLPARFGLASEALSLQVKCADSEDPA